MTSSASPWIEVDHDAIAWNVGVIRAVLQPWARLLAVVKSNAYGHGAAEVARTVLQHGAEALGVARIEEGIALREAGIAAPILIFGPTPVSCGGELLQYQLTPTVTGAADARGLAGTVPSGRSLAVHLKVDTGMGRLGCLVQPHADAGTVSAQAVIAAREAAVIAATPGLRLQGVFTHFACAESPETDLTRNQFRAFTIVLEAISQQGIRPSLRHAANSAGIINHPETHLDLVRAGIALYGYGWSRSSGLRPAMALKTRVVQIRNVPAGTTVGYGMAHRVESPTTLATVALGYGDGYDRAHSGRGRMLVRGRFAPVIGRVCMDLTMLDVGGIPGVAVGDEVVAFGQQADAELPADTVAGEIGSIPYEALTSLTARVQRIHRGARSPALVTTAA